MGEKRIGDGSFADAFVAPGVGRNARLDRIEDLFNWSRFEKLLKPMRSALDPEATWTRQYGRSTFGYKAHIAVDQFSCLIRQAVLTPANINESLVADNLIRGDEKAVYADKGYEHKDRRKRLKAQGIKDRFMHRSHKNQDGLPHWQKVRNRLIIPLRSSIEKLFGTMKRSYGYDRVRYLGLERNAAHLHLLCIAMNMRRAEVLTS